MPIQQLTFTHVTERDMDLLLVEELKCSAAFRSWLMSKLSRDLRAEGFLSDADVAVRHSVERAGEGYGETDIEVVLTRPGLRRERLILFIEDKIGAPFTPSQPQRYRLATEAARRDGRAEAVACILFAPGEYLARHDTTSFDVCVPYEALAEYFASQARSAAGELAARYSHRAEAVGHAVGRYRRGYEPVADLINTSFWKAYHALACTAAADLHMDDPGDKPTYSIDVYFRRALPLAGSLRKAWLLKHSLENGAVMIEVSQWGQRFRELAPLIQPRLEPGMSLQQAGKSIQIRIAVPKLDTAKALGDQANQVRQGLAALLRLRTWYLARPDLVERCQQVAEPIG